MCFFNLRRKLEMKTSKLLASLIAVFFTASTSLTIAQPTGGAPAGGAPAGGAPAGGGGAPKAGGTSK
jgi:hypothetical protein